MARQRDMNQEYRDPRFFFPLEMRRIVLTMCQGGKKKMLEDQPYLFSNLRKLQVPVQTH